MKKSKWNKSKALLEARKYKNISSFQKNNRGAYNFLYKNNYMKELHQVLLPKCKSNGYWSKEKILKLSSKFNHLCEFKKEYPSAYRVALREKFSKDLKFTKKKRSKKYTLQYISVKAKEYKTRKDFMENERGCYDAARRLGKLDVVVSHMKRDYGLANRSVYIFKFSNNSVYVGLSYDPEKRKMQHINGYGNKSVKKLVKDNKYSFKILYKDLTPDEAAKKEIYLIKKYKNKGLNILNKKIGGDLGSYKFK